MAFGSIGGILTTIGSGSTTLSSSTILSGTGGFTVAGSGAVTMNGVNNITGVNAVQTINLNSSVVGGSFTLSINGQTTAAINYIDLPPPRRFPKRETS